MTVLTGETGAGKSILVDALGLVLGDRGGAQLVRDRRRTEPSSAAEFDVNQHSGRRDARMAGGTGRSTSRANACLLRRVINADGRSRAFINGNAATALSSSGHFGELLLDIHGQHFHQSLSRRRNMQRDLLDHFGSLLGELRQAVASAYTDWKTVADRLARPRGCRMRTARRGSTCLTFQLAGARGFAVGRGRVR